LLKSSIRISKEQFTLKRKIRFSSSVRFDIDITTKGAEIVTVEDTEIITDVEKIMDIIEEKKLVFFFYFIKKNS